MPSVKNITMQKDICVLARVRDPYVVMRGSYKLLSEAVFQTERGWARGLGVFVEISSRHFDFLAFDAEEPQLCWLDERVST